MSLSLFLQQHLACLVCVTWTVCEMGCRWSYSRCFVGCCFQDLFKTVHSILVHFPSSFFSMYFVSVHVVHPYSSVDTAKAGKKYSFILLGRSDFHTIDNLSIPFHDFARCMLKSLSVDKMLLARYVNWSTNFRGLPLRVEMDPFSLKHVLSFICIHIKANASSCLLALSYAVGILLGLLYLQEVQDHLCSLHLS